MCVGVGASRRTSSGLRRKGEESPPCFDELGEVFVQRRARLGLYQRDHPLRVLRFP